MTEIAALGAVPTSELFAPGPDQVRQLVLAWLLAKRSPRTAEAYQRDIAMWLAWLAERDVPVLAARRVHADAWARWMETTPHGRYNQPASKATVNRRLASVSSFYDYCAAEEAIDANRIRAVERHKMDRQHSETFRPSVAEAKAILAEAAARGPRMDAYVNLSVFTGGRVTEIIGAQVGDLRTDGGRRCLRVTRKNGRRDWLWFKAAHVGPVVDAYLANRARIAGVRVRELSGPIFIDRSGRPWTRQAAANEVKKLGEAVGCPKLTPHSFRHLFATLAKAAGAHIDEIQVFLGHRDAATTRRYLAATDLYDRHPGQKIAALLGLDDAGKTT